MQQARYARHPRFIETFDRFYGRSFLRPNDRVVRPGKVEAARNWYIKNGFPKP